MLNFRPGLEEEEILHHLLRQINLDTLQDLEEVCTMGRLLQ